MKNYKALSRKYRDKANANKRRNRRLK